MTQFLEDPILPDPPPGTVPVLHDREYRVRAYRLSSDRLLLQGALRDQKPPGLFVPGDERPVTFHHMMVEIEVAIPELEIVAVNTRFETFPHESCPEIVKRYGQLVGLSFTRGFTHRVRELFGGPRGCSHTTALLQAMAPVAVQSRSGFEIHEALEAGEPHPFSTRGPRPDGWQVLINTCHVWDEDGSRVESIRAGRPREVPLSIRHRLAELRRD